MLVKLFASAVYGVEAVSITAEVDVLEGTKFFIVGLPDSAVKESEQRVNSAIKNNGYRMPRTKVVINLSPADIKKSGTAFDLPITIGILGATDQVKIDKFETSVFMGEVALDGKILPIKGALPIAIQARKDSMEFLFLPNPVEKLTPL